MPDDNPTLCFVDTNVWLYAFIDGNDQDKSALARALMKQSDIVLSTQVVTEVCVNLLKKASFPEDRLARLIDSFYEKYFVADLRRSRFLSASDLRTRYSLSYWDSMIVASALETGARVLYSEDMQHGLVLNGELRVANPFVVSHV